MHYYKVLNKQQYSKDNFAIVPIRFEDRLSIMQWRNEQLYHLRQQRPLTVEDQDNYFNTVVSRLFEQEQPNQILFSYLENGICIGYGGLVHINWTDKNAEISFVMNTSLERERFHEIWVSYLELLEMIAFTELKFHKIYTYAFDLRPHLYEALLTAGFNEDARLKEHCLFDGKFYDVLIHSKIKTSATSNLRKVNSEDARLIFDWANDAEVRGNAINEEPIQWENHLKWFQSKLNSNDTHMFILEIENKPIGQIRFDNYNDFLEIDYSIDRSSRGLGYGKQIIAEAMKLHNQSNFRAVVKNNNVASKKIFLNLGFVKDVSSTVNYDDKSFEAFIYKKKLKMRNFIILSEKKWNEPIFIALKEKYPADNWFLINKKEDFTLDVVNKINPTQIFIPHWSHIIKKEIFEAFECIVFHMTDLPYGRGGSPLQNLIVRGHKSTKITALKVDKGIDTGDVFLKQDLLLEGTAQQIFMRSSDIILQMIITIIEQELRPVKQEGTIVEFKRRTPSESDISKINELETVYDFVRMLDCEGYPHAFLETEFFKFEFTNASLTEDNIMANVRISKK